MEEAFIKALTFSFYSKTPTPIIKRNIDLFEHFWKIDDIHSNKWEVNESLKWICKLTYTPKRDTEH